MKGSIKRYSMILQVAVIVLLTILICPKSVVAQEQKCHTLLIPNCMTSAILDSVCHSVEKCICIAQGIPCYGNIIIYDTLIIVRVEQLTGAIPRYPYVCFHENIPFFIHYSDNLEKLFEKTPHQVSHDTIFERIAGKQEVVNGYVTPIEEKDYYEARYVFDVDSCRIVLCCEHRCIENTYCIPNLHPQNIHHSLKSAKSLYIVSPYVDTASVAIVQLSVKFNNIRQMKILEINDISYLWIFKSQHNKYPDKECFYYGGCYIQDSVQYQYYKSKIIEIAYRLHFYVPKKYKMFPRFKKRYGYDDYLIKKYQVSECEPVKLILKVLPCSL